MFVLLQKFVIHWLFENDTITLCFCPFSFDQTEGIVVIGATNFPEILDKYVLSFVSFSLRALPLLKIPLGWISSGKYPFVYILIFTLKCCFGPQVYR